jgi:hypothetical protein
VDNGDGTFSERQECRTKYRSEPVYDDKCHYTVQRWTLSRTETAAGASVDQTPAWPPVSLARTGQCVGCEREGARSAEYVVRFYERAENDTSECRFDEGKWRSFAVDSGWSGELSLIGSVLDCDSLRAK